jgi:hypothetical protein
MLALRFATAPGQRELVFQPAHLRVRSDCLVDEPAPQALDLGFERRGNDGWHRRAAGVFLRGPTRCSCRRPIQIGRTVHTAEFTVFAVKVPAQRRPRGALDGKRQERRSSAKAAEVRPEPESGSK